MDDSGCDAWPLDRLAFFRNLAGDQPADSASVSAPLGGPTGPARARMGGQRRTRPQSPPPAEYGPGAAGDSAGFMPNEALGEPPAQPSRAPTDAAPYTSTDGSDDDEEGPCIMCIYGADMRVAGQGDAYSEIVELIKRYHGNSTSNRELVELVHEAYEKKIRKYRDYGRWSRRAIWEHVMHHMADPEIQTNENANNILAQIEALRNVAWTRLPSSDAEGRPSFVPALANLKLMVELIKTHNAMLNEARKRTMQRG